MELVRIQKRLFYLIIAVLLLGTMVVIIAINLPSGKSSTPLPLPTPSAIPTEKAADVQQSKTYTESVKKINQEQEDFLSHEAAVGQLIKKLPYRTTTFSLDYSFQTNNFTVTLLTDQGERDFETFLQKNGVADKRWIRNLNIVKSM